MYKNSGKEKAIAELFNRYAHLIFGVCVKYSKTKNICEDVVIQIFETIMEAAKKTDIANFKSWLYVVTRNECFRLNKSLEKIEYTENLNHETPETEDYNSISDAKIKEALNKLKYEQKICVELFYFDNLSYKEIAEKTGFEEKKIKSSIQNGKRNLSIILNKVKDELIWKNIW